ncbi:MAG: hypothetical protein OEV94_07405 [Deltaproteobacteria bacterium]|nr:hypothetical protein [Deltaproteobacteria bacterium]
MLDWKGWIEVAKNWSRLKSNTHRVLAMNRRNLHLIYPNNPRRFFPQADDKIYTKEIMEKAGVPVPKTHRVYRYFYQLESLESDFEGVKDFVIKPAHGKQGGGIRVISERQGNDWVEVSGERHTTEDIKAHIYDIIFGIYSFDLHDQALIEERLIQHEEVNWLSPGGLADIRVILLKGKPVMAMTRLPTKASHGKANLHQGALGVGIDMATGRTIRAIHHGREVFHHPDTGREVVGAVLPYWSEVLSVARRAAEAVDLGYLGVDISLTPQGPSLLEINARPGLEIQNANLTGIMERLAEPAEGLFEY